jgi:hypothetical protein
MDVRHFLSLTGVASLLIAAIGPNLRADDSEFRYVRPYGSRTLIWRARDSVAIVGGQIFYASGDVTSRPPAPNNWLSFRHPYTQAYVSVPVALPNGTPRIYNHTDRVVYDYGALSVAIQFARDGSVNVSYNSKTP